MAPMTKPTPLAKYQMVTRMSTIEPFMISLRSGRPINAVEAKATAAEAVSQIIQLASRMSNSRHSRNKAGLAQAHHHSFETLRVL